MTPEQIQAMAKGLAEGQAIWYVLSACIGGAIAGLGTYLAEKGKNRATKEDIAAITLEVKKVEDVFNRGLADLNAHHQLRMVAAEARLKAQQGAYSHWHELQISLLHFKGDARETIVKCSNWFSENCVFLTDRSRSSFIRAIQIAGVINLHNTGAQRMHMDGFIDESNSLSRLGTIFIEDASLPELSKVEADVLREAGIKLSPA